MGSHKFGRRASENLESQEYVTERLYTHHNTAILPVDRPILPVDTPILPADAVMESQSFALANGLLDSNKKGFE